MQKLLQITSLLMTNDLIITGMLTGRGNNESMKEQPLPDHSEIPGTSKNQPAIIYTMHVVSRSLPRCWSVILQVCVCGLTIQKYSVYLLSRQMFHSFYRIFILRSFFYSFLATINSYKHSLCAYFVLFRRP